MKDITSKLKRAPSQTQHKQSFVRDDHLSDKRWYERINYLNLTIVVMVPLMGFYGLFTTTHQWQTWVWAIAYYFWTGFGITAGYHRLWSHRAYSVKWPLEFFLLLGGTGALEGSCKWWSLLHRAHHRWTDTDKDPYNAKRGFWYAHVGWLLLDSIHVHDVVDLTDLRSNSMLRWQHKQYAWFGPFMAFIFPCLIAGLGWGDYRGGFYIAGFFRLLFVQHATWCVNSVAHFFGRHSFDDTISPRDSIITGLLTLGEGYHNFHHEFPNDYRNGIHWWDYDPTKWFIRVMCDLGLAYDLNRFEMNEIKRGELDMQQKKLDFKKSFLNWGVPIDKLPEWSQKDIQNEIKKGKVIIVLSGVVHDVTEFVGKGKHPGGKKIVIERNGKDVSEEFNGKIYNHTNAARNILSHFRIAVITDNKKDE